MNGEGSIKKNGGELGRWGLGVGCVFHNAQRPIPNASPPPSRLKHIQRPELLAENRFARGVQPALEHRGVDVAEIDFVAQIALIEVR